jgi:hypothetical protein
MMVIYYHRRILRQSEDQRCRKLATKRQYRTSLGLRNAQIRISPDRTDRNVCSPSARVRASDSEEKSESKQLLVAKNILTSSPSQGGLAISGERTPSRVNNFFPPAIRIDSSPFPDDSRHVSSAAPLAHWRRLISAPGRP